MITTKQELLFLDMFEAQDLLNKQDPGYQIAVAESGLSVIVDQNNEVILVIAPTAETTNP